MLCISTIKPRTRGCPLWVPWNISECPIGNDIARITNSVWKIGMQPSFESGQYGTVYEFHTHPFHANLLSHGEMQGWRTAGKKKNKYATL